ncbi:hypothetical protein M0R45_035719 [Rubus argutus]|uniref:NADH dehydrogenase subunit 5 n=1 Tax=Rubus argutus TaxID=59490 RepID=A0AAW1VXQ8_RUBAR
MLWRPTRLILLGCLIINAAKFLNLNATAFVALRLSLIAACARLSLIAAMHHGFADHHVSNFLTIMSSLFAGTNISYHEGLELIGRFSSFPLATTTFGDNSSNQNNCYPPYIEDMKALEDLIGAFCNWISKFVMSLNHGDKLIGRANRG